MTGHKFSWLAVLSPVNNAVLSLVNNTMSLFSFLQLFFNPRLLD